MAYFSVFVMKYAILLMDWTMPHFGLIDGDAHDAVQQLFLRARLHIRGGKRRLRQGKISLGILTIYDALNTALQWYISIPEHRRDLKIQERDNLKDDENVFDILVRSGVIDRRAMYNELNKLVDMALNKDMSSYDYTEMLNDIEAVMTQLEVMPFDESILPPEDPATP